MTLGYGCTETVQGKQRYAKDLARLQDLHQNSTLDLQALVGQAVWLVELGRRSCVLR